VLGWDAIDQHVRLRRDNGRVDESEEEEAANEGTDGSVGRVGVFPLAIS
jgi:hypothetical protein